MSDILDSRTLCRPDHRQKGSSRSDSVSCTPSPALTLARKYAKWIAHESFQAQFEARTLMQSLWPLFEAALLTKQINLPLHHAASCLWPEAGGRKPSTQSLLMWQRVQLHGCLADVLIVAGGHLPPFIT